MLQGKRILLGVTGSISAYKACDLIQRLKESGADVRVIATHSATQLVTANTFAALTGKPVIVDAWEGVSQGRMDHIELARWADVFLIAPCTAHTLAELAQGLTGSLLSTVYLAYTGQTVIAPAMNTQMLLAPTTQRNLNILSEDGVIILPSGEGVLACGEVGEGKLLEVGAIVAHLSTVLAAESPLPPLFEKKVLISLGHTQEPIDDVRFFSNRSSGKTGLALARAFWLAGAEVSIVAGHTDETVTGGFTELTRVATTQQFDEAMAQKAEGADIIVMAAALADYVPKNQVAGKIKNSKSMLNIELKPSNHVLGKLGKMKKPGQILVGFALETENALPEAHRKLKEKNCDLVVVNNPVSSDSGFGKPDVYAGIVGLAGEVMPLSKVSKDELAIRLVREVAKLTLSEG